MFTLKYFSASRVTSALRRVLFLHSWSWPWSSLIRLGKCPATRPQPLITPTAITQQAWDVDPMSQRLRRWANIDQTSGQCLMFASHHFAAECCHANSRRSSNVAIMLGQRRRLWVNFIITIWVNVSCLLGDESNSFSLQGSVFLKRVTYIVGIWFAEMFSNNGIESRCMQAYF